MTGLEVNILWDDYSPTDSRADLGDVRLRVLKTESYGWEWYVDAGRPFVGYSVTHRGAAQGGAEAKAAAVEAYPRVLAAWGVLDADRG
jgi:hypothetical protein